jgi:hypothetical protein
MMAAGMIHRMKVIDQRDIKTTPDLARLTVAFQYFAFDPTARTNRRRVKIGRKPND